MIAARLATKLAVGSWKFHLVPQPDQLSADEIRRLCDPDFF